MINFKKNKIRLMIKSNILERKYYYTLSNLEKLNTFFCFSNL